MSADKRWYQLKQRAATDRDLRKATFRVFVNLIDHLARKPHHKSGDCFVLSWRIIQKLTGGSQWGCCKKQAYRHIRALEKAQYIFPTPRNYVRNFILAKESHNPAAVKYYNLKFEKLKGVTASQWAQAKQEIAETPEHKPAKKKKSWED